LTTFHCNKNPYFENPIEIDLFIFPIKIMVIARKRRSLQF